MASASEEASPTTPLSTHSLRYPKDVGCADVFRITKEKLLSYMFVWVCTKYMYIKKWF